MTRFLSILLWTAVFLLIVLAIDQLLVRVPASYPAHVAVATFYRDLRIRAFDLAKGKSSVPAAPPVAAPPVTGKAQKKPAPVPAARPATIEGVIEKRRDAAPKPVVAKPQVTKPVAKTTTPAVKVPAPPPVKSRPAPPRETALDESPRYVYEDASGELHFAETLAEVPEEYREKAKRMGE